MYTYTYIYIPNKIEMKWKNERKIGSEEGLQFLSHSKKKNCAGSNHFPSPSSSPWAGAFCDVKETLYRCNFLHFTQQCSLAKKR